MKKIRPSKETTVSTPSSGNVFLDIGFEPAEAHLLLMRSELMNKLEKYLAAQGWTQSEAAKRLGITQPRVSKLMKGAWEDFSIDMLLLFAGRLGIVTELLIAA